MLKTMTQAVSQSATKWGAASCKCFHEDDRKNDIRRLHAERKREKRPSKKKIPVYCAVQSQRKGKTCSGDAKVQRRNTIGGAVASERPSAEDKSSSAGKINEDGNTEKVEEITRRIEIVRRNFCDLFTDATDEVLPEWIEQR